MKIFINLPTWLGDAIMASAALKAVMTHFQSLDKNTKFILYGSFVATELFKDLPNSKIIKAQKSRYKQILKLRQELGIFDYAFSFRSALSSKIVLNLIKAEKRFCFNKKENKDEHQVLKYLKFIEKALDISSSDDELFLPSVDNFDKTLLKKANSSANKKLLGLNPGAKYGSAKRWESSYFAQVAKHFSHSHDIVIFGVSSEKEICDEIENELIKSGVSPLNLCGKTSISELASYIKALDLFITNDSGPMHIAAVFKVKTIAIFGPTKFSQTSPWQNQNARLMHLSLACQPCMKRVCPLKHHKCMRDLSPKMIIQACESLVK